MNKQKKEETIVVIVGIIFVSIMAGLKLNISVPQIIIVIVGFSALYILLNYIITKLFKPLYDARDKKKKTR